MHKVALIWSIRCLDSWIILKLGICGSSLEEIITKLFCRIRNSCYWYSSFGLHDVGSHFIFYAVVKNYLRKYWRKTQTAMCFWQTEDCSKYFIQWGRKQPIRSSYRKIVIAVSCTLNWSISNLKHGFDFLFPPAVGALLLDALRLSLGQILILYNGNKNRIQIEDLF